MTDPIPSNQDIALYVHWPFCASKCPYCDFNSHVVNSVDPKIWCSAIITELQNEAKRLPRRILQSIFFGGGTPSLMEPETVATIISHAKRLWKPKKRLEITLEANPTSVDSYKFEGFRKAGITRLSLGLQSLNQHQLEFLGRKHSVEEGRTAIDLAQSFFDRISIDMIYALPNQSRKEWEIELSEALELINNAHNQHISCYQLTIEPNTPFEKSYDQGKILLPPENKSIDLYETTGEILAKHKILQYEISNYATAKNECQHNVHIWSGGEYVGVGPGAHGRITIDDEVTATHCIKPPFQWLKQVHAIGHGKKEEYNVAKIDRAKELVILGLRLNKGLNLEHMENIGQRDKYDIISRINIQYLEDGGLIKQENNNIKATRRGKLLINELIKQIIK